MLRVCWRTDFLNFSISACSFAPLRVVQSLHGKNAEIEPSRAFQIAVGKSNWHIRKLVRNGKGQGLQSLLPDTRHPSQLFPSHQKKREPRGQIQAAHHAERPHVPPPQMRSKPQNIPLPHIFLPERNAPPMPFSPPLHDARIFPAPLTRPTPKTP